MNDMVRVEYERPDLPVVGAAVSAARAIVVDSQETYDFANEQLGLVKSRYKAIEAQRKAIVDPINKAKDAVQALFKPVLDDLTAAEGVYKGAMLTFQQEQRRIQQEEQARLDEANRKERERLEKQAAKAAEKGHTEKAEVLAATAAVMMAPIATSTYVEPKGLSTRKVWKARVTDKTALIKAIIENPAFLNLIEIDTGALDRLVRAMEGRVPLAGVECYEEETLARRAA
ncbi:MAG TPA: hypothetical protein PKV98_04385 [Burkholderiaceae bacterium]|nr:hypothetical protein [Burkholderiaceae bacterium]